MLAADGETRLITVSATDYNNIGKFLNRILGMKVQQQNALFQYFSDTLGAVVQEAKKNGRYDMGILGKADVIARPSEMQKEKPYRIRLVLMCRSPSASDLGSGDEKVKKVDCRKFLTPGYTTSGHVELHTVCSRVLYSRLTFLKERFLKERFSLYFTHKSRVKLLMSTKHFSGSLNIHRTLDFFSPFSN